MEAPLAAVGLTAARVLEYKEGKRCSFWFVRAEKLRAFSGTTPPRLQELRRRHPDWLEQRTISFHDGYGGAYIESTLIVSHVWEEPSEPDRQGAQFTAVQAHLRAHLSIVWVWYDHWCMPQGEDKEDWEDVEFTVMLPNINLLYLFCAVLILQDRSYMSRFWVSEHQSA